MRLPVLSSRVCHELCGAFLTRSLPALRRSACTVLLASSGLFIPGNLLAQGPADAALRGQVILPGGAPAAGATLTLLSTDGAPTRRLILGRDGRFLLLRLPAGDYRVQVDLPGFAETLIAPNLPVSLGGGDLAELELQFRARPQTSVARSLLPQLGVASRSSAAGDPAASFQTDAPTLSALPLLSRDWLAASALDSTAADATLAESPDASSSDADSAQDASDAVTEPDSPGSGLSYGGLSETGNSYRQDGLSAEQGFRSGPRGSALGGARAASSFAQGAVRSLRVLPSTFSAQRGGAAGAVFSVSTGGGGDRLHGTVYGFARQSAWAAVNPYALVQHFHSGVLTNALVLPRDSELQFGVSTGLPLSLLHLPGLRRRTRGGPTLFATVEYQLRNGTAESSPATPGFYALTPIQAALLGTRGVPRASAQAALNFLDSLSGPVPRHDQRILAFLRFDTRLGGHDNLGATFQRSQYDSPAGAQLTGPSPAILDRGRGSVGGVTLAVTAASGHWLHTFRPGFSHDLRGQWAHDLQYETPHLPLPGEPAIAPGGFAPQVSIATNSFSYGTPAALGRQAYPDEHRIELADSFLAAFGRHLLTFGGDWSRLNDHIATTTNQDGTFLYDSGSTNGRAGGLVDWITDYTFNVNAYPNGGCPSIYSPAHYFCFRSFTQSFGGSDSRFVTHEVAVFAEDALRPLRGLTVTLGVRSDYTLLPIPQTPNRKLDAALASLTGPATGSTAVFPEDRNNFGPRFSLAWAPRGGRWFTARVGYGVFFGSLPGATVRAALANTALPATTSSIRLTPTVETACPQVANQGFGYPCAYISAPPSAIAATTSATEFGSKFRLPAIQRASFTLERAAGRHLGVIARYQMAIATQLPSSVDCNIAPSTSTVHYILQGGDGLPGLRSGETFELPLYTSRLASQYGPVSTLLSSANATYHALTLEGRLQGVSWIELRGSFTFSRSIDYAPQLGATPLVNGRFDPYTPGFDKSLSSLNFPQRFAGDLILRSQVHRGPTEVRFLTDGWRLAAIATASSGAPYSYQVFGGTRLPGGRESLNGSGGATYLPTVGRNTLRLPPRGRVDLRLGRSFPLGAERRLEAFLQSFNLLNSRNLSRVETRAFLLGTPAVPAAPIPLLFQDAAALSAEGLSTPAFGQPLSSTSGLSRERLLKTGLRFTF